MSTRQDPQANAILKSIIAKWMAGDRLSQWEQTILADLQEQVAAIQLGRLLLPATA